jgi:hypothetical protein
MVVQAYNPSYLGGRGKRIVAWGLQKHETLSKTN